MATGELTPGQRFEIDKAIRAAEESSRFEFSVFVGAAGPHPRAHATRLHASLVVPDRSVLVLVDPDARVIEVVTGAVVRRQLSDASVGLAVLAMQSAFATGDLVGGLRHGVALLAEHARANDPAPSGPGGR